MSEPDPELQKEPNLAPPCEPLRLLRLISRLNLGGPALQIRALTPPLAKRDTPSLIVHGALGPGEAPCPGLPPLLSLDQALSLGPRATGRVLLPGLGPGQGLRATLRALRDLRRLTKTFAPHVLHSHTAKAGLLATLALHRGPFHRGPFHRDPFPNGPSRKGAAPKGTPILHSFHGHVLRDYFGPAKSHALRLLERRLSRRRAASTCVSESCRAELEALGIGPLRVVPPTVANPTAPLSRAAAREALGLPQDTRLILFLGRLVPIKDPALFLETVALVSARERTPTLPVLIGTGPLLSQLRDAHPEARFLGPVEDAARYLRAFDLLLMTSKREGLPIAALEALMQGLPVLGPAVPGLSDLQSMGVPLCRERSAGALAEGVAEVRGPTESQIQTLRERHRPERMADIWAQIYRDLRTQ